MSSYCEICKRTSEKLYRHHLIPKQRGGKNGPIIMCCKTCAQQVHMLFTEKELSSFSLTELIKQGKMKKYIKWIQDKPGNYGIRMSNHVKGKHGR